MEAIFQMKKTQVRVYFRLFGDEFLSEEVTNKLGIPLLLLT